jgi:nickel-dependent lactate racemase
MRIDLPYGSRSVPLEIDDDLSVEVLSPNPVALPHDEAALIEDALNNPTGTPPLERIAGGGKRVAVLCDDISRITPTDRILSRVIARLNRAGVRDSEIQIIFALGSHRPMTRAEMARKVGADLLRRLKVVNSEFRDRSLMVRLPGLPGGPEIWLDRRAVEADIRVGLGGVLPHPAAGWSGGGKIVFPGVAGEDTVAAFHLMHGLTPENMFGATESRVRLAMESWVAERVGLEFIVNVAFTPDGRIYRVAAGHFILAHRRAVADAREIFCVPTGRRADVVVTTSHPADADLWQAGKGLLAADLAARPGGTAILVAPCPEGVGPHPHYLDYLSEAGPEELLARAERTPASQLLPLSVAAASLRVRRRLDVAFVSDGMTPEQALRGRMRPFPNAQAALEDALIRHGRGARITVITHGAETIPVVDGEPATRVTHQ